MNFPFEFSCLTTNPLNLLRPLKKSYKKMSNIAYGTFRHQHQRVNDGKESIGGDNFEQVETNLEVLDIHVSLKNIKKLDKTSESDPMVVLSIPMNGQIVEVGRTEVIWDDCNPSFIKFFKAAFIFEIQQPLIFDVYDVDSENADLKKHDYVGRVETNMQILASNKSRSIDFPIMIGHDDSGSRGTLVLSIEQSTNNNSFMKGQVSVKKLKKIHTFSRNKPYVLFTRASETGAEIPAFRTATAPRCYSYNFKEFEIPLANLCNGELSTPITVSVMNYSSRHADVLIGSIQNNVSYFMENIGKQHEIHNKDNKKTGNILFSKFAIEKRPTFYEYLQSGLQLNLITAIDFTCSNGDPSVPHSLHYINPEQLNQYERCIWEVGSIICPYDSDQEFAVYGFGAHLDGRVRHCFPLNGNAQNPNVHGLEGIVDVYKQFLKGAVLSGPTYFHEIINAASEVSKISFQTSHTYTVLMILTDGCINDFNDTARSIVNASQCPLSIIIIGVGSSNFSFMEDLDGDNGELAKFTRGRPTRDIVQFVPFNQYQNGNLAAEVLAEIPKQVYQFCSANGFVPKSI